MEFAGLGTVVNILGIIAGGFIGLTFGKFINKKLQDMLQMSCAISVIFISIGGTLKNMLTVNSDGSIEIVGTMMMIASLSIGCLIGELIDIDKKIENFGAWLKSKTGNEGDSKFIEGFVISSLTVCVGAMAIIGAMEDRLMNNYSILFAKSILDLIIIMILTASLGKGCIFSAIPVGIFQGTITFFAGFIKPFMTDGAISNISYIGNILIFCVGINLMFGQKIRVANLLPSIIIAYICSTL